MAITGGGTGGHVYPALAVIDGMRRILARGRDGAARADDARDDRDARAGDSCAEPSRGDELELLWIGSRRKEAQILPKYGIDLVYVDIIPFKRSLSPKSIAHNLKLARNLMSGRAVKQAAAHLARFKPDLLLSTGGYVAYPACVAAVKMVIPIYQIEPNAAPGLVTQKLAGRARMTYCATDECALALGRAPTTATGIPVRDYSGLKSKQEILDSFGLQAERVTVLVTGGSLGARFINNIVLEHIPALVESHSELVPSIQILHQTGSGDLAEAQSLAKELPFPYSPVEYIDDMPEALYIADILIGRSGASAVAEITHFGIPAIFVPYAHHKDRQQLRNALPLVDAGVACVHNETEFDIDDFAFDFLELVRACRNLELKARIREFDSNAADAIAKSILEDTLGRDGKLRGSNDV